MSHDVSRTQQIPPSVPATAQSEAYRSYAGVRIPNLLVATGLVSSMSHENKPTAGAPAPGSLVMYPADHPTGESDRYRIAEVVGPVVVDPTTAGTWVGVRLPDHPDGMDIVACASITNIVPPC